MSERNSRGTVLARGSWALVALVAAGCRQQEAPVVAPVTTPPTLLSVSPAPVSPGETFALSQVRLRYDAQHSRLLSSYTVHNRGPTRERAFLCLDALDKEGDPLQLSEALERISLRPGDSDEVLDEEHPLRAEVWQEAAFLRVYVEEASCLQGASGLRSAELWLDPSNQPVPPEARPRRPPTTPEEADPTHPWFRLEGARVTWGDHSSVLLNYTITNLARTRVSGQLCARLIDDARCDCQGGEYESQTLRLGRGGSERRAEPLAIADITRWGKGQHLLLYVGSLGCTSPSEQALSNVLRLSRPEPPPPP